MANKLDINTILSKRFTNLIVITEGIPHITKGGYVHRTIFCKCDCGIEKDFQLSNVLNGKTKSCGCYSAETARQRMKIKNKTHGGTFTSEYNTWCSMKKRCLNPNNKGYKNYGGRGINICKEWINSFEVFISEMGKKPTINHSIERIDNSKGYYKENCKWATKKEQCRNVRNNVLYEFKGKLKCVGEWCEVLKMTRYKTEKYLKLNGKIID